MSLRNLVILAVCALFALTHAVVAQEKTTPQTTVRPDAATSFTAPASQPRYPACCEACPAGGCTGCNSGPEGLNCGSGLIKAKCQTVNNVVTCVKDE